MTTHTTFRRLLLGTALTLPMAGLASAQTIRIDDAQLATKSEECQLLGRAVQMADPLPATVTPEEVAEALNDDDAEACTALRADFADADATTTDTLTTTDEVTETETDQVTEQVDLSQEATIEGQATVTVPEPNVDVQVPAPSVRVTTQTPDVTVMEGASEIEVVQQKPTITVEIPEIRVTVSIPAPNLYVLSADPEVQVSAADPQVEVEQGPPVISVTQGDPELAIDLDLKEDATATDTDAVETADGTVNQVDGDVETVAGQPEVVFVQPEGGPNVTVNRTDPTTSFEGMEPEVLVMMAEQPTVQIEQSGEMTVTLETAEEREQRRAQQASAETAAPTEATMPAADPAAPVADPAATPETGLVVTDTVDGSAPAGTAMPGEMTVTDLRAMDVITADGENLGAPEAFIDINGQPHMIMTDGGFLGIGEKEVPVPMTRVTVQDGNLVLTNLTEAEVEAAGDFDYDRNLILPDDSQVRIGGN